MSRDGIFFIIKQHAQCTPSCVEWMEMQMNSIVCTAVERVHVLCGVYRGLAMVHTF